MPEIRGFFDKFGGTLPQELAKSLEALQAELATATVY